MANAILAFCTFVLKQLSDSPWAQNEGWRLRPQTPAFYILALSISPARPTQSKSIHLNDIRALAAHFLFGQAVESI
jgi:hypothetical protein